MDVVKAVETYITKLVSTPSAMKVLLLDTHTVRFSSSLLPCIDIPLVVLPDADCLSCLDTVDALIASSLSHGSDR